jgi:hypothetical protein
MGIGTTSPINKLDIEGGAVIGATYSGTYNAPTNGLLVQGNVGIGTTSPINKLDIEGGAVIGATYSGTYNAPTNGLLVQGNMGIGTTTPNAKLAVTGSVNTSWGNEAAILINNTAINGTGWYLRAGATGTDAGRCFSIADDVTNRFVISYPSGNIGIGTTTPQYPLEVNGCTNISGLSYAWYAYNNGNASYDCCGSSGCYSIKASNRILAEEFNAISDRRIKEIIGISETRNDLETINKLRVTLYHYKDMVGKGNNMKQGFIAQEVEEVVPDAVSRTSDFVPDIYAIPDHVKYNENLKELTITLNKEHSLAVNDLVRVYAADRMAEKTVSSVISPNEFILSDWEGRTDSLFIYGKKVDDFRVLDYDRIYTIGIGAIQELSGQLNEANEKIKSLEARLDEIEMAVGSQQSAVSSRQSAVNSQRSAVSSK